MLYDPQIVRPMRDELTCLGAVELLTPEAVDQALSADGTVLLVVNSVCGCAAANARPAVAIATGHDVQPDRIVTVFAGQEAEATERSRSYMPGYRPSSPAIALFRDGEHVFMLERHQIEGREASAIAADLRHAYDRYCSAAV
ncbi:MAG: BrxA/BrxB family bacilliredoxin [Gemmatimonadota bacterium]|nr:BrxA/BrxB family bacilliredoxin [Gemmatimonadota bacterium]MDH3427501.1 BrxA/BrxB family bacilliredoxin [Gemmatimonadota bacterium]